jgi:aryl-alcohol dehydrogenase-like predicted oxidoreductase
MDLCQIHWPAWKDAPESASPGSIEEAVGVLTKLKDQKKIRHLCVSNFNVTQMQRARRIASITSLQPAYSLVATQVETAILPYALSQRIGVVVYSPTGSGLLTGSLTRERIAAMPGDDWRKRDRNFQEPLLSRNLRLGETLRSVGQRHKASPGEVAIARTLRNPAVTGAIVGVRDAQQARVNVGAASLELTPDEIAEIEDRVVREAA